MANEVSLKFTGDVQQLLASMGQVNNKMLEQVSAIRQLNEHSGRFKSTANDAFGSGIRQLARMASATAAVTAGFRLAVAELRNLKDAQDEAARSQITTEAAVQGLIANLGSSTKEDIDALVKGRLPALSAATGVETRFLAQAMSSAVSASGGRPDIAEKGVALGARVLAHAPQDIDQFAGAMIDLRDVLGGSVEQAHGFLAALGEMSRVADPAMQARNLPKAVVGVTGLGATPQEAGAFVAYLSNAMKDVTGEMSGTAAITFAKELRDFLPKVVATESGSAFGNRLAMVQADPALAQTFLFGGKVGGRKVTGASFEAKARAPLEAFAARGSELYTNYLSGFGTDADLLARSQRMLSNMELSPFRPAASAARDFAAYADAERLRDKGAEGSIVREGVREALRASGESWLQTQYELQRFDWQTDWGRRNVRGLGGQILRERAGRIEHPEYEPLQVGDPEKARRLTELAEKVERGAADLTKAMDALRVDLNRNSDATQQNTRATPGAGNGQRPVRADD